MHVASEEASQIQAFDQRHGRAHASHETAVSAPFFLIATTPLTYLRTRKEG